MRFDMRLFNKNKEETEPSIEYPYEEGDFIILGPEVFTDKNQEVICWRGDNYIRKTPFGFTRELYKTPLT